MTGQIFAVNKRYLSLTHSIVRAELLNSGMRNLVSINETSFYGRLWHKAYFDILKRLCMDHECDRRTDGQTFL